MKHSAQATNRKISWFSREAEAESLNLSPAFQRRPIWNQEQSSYLIDTILQGLPFPEIYMRAITSLNGKTVFEVVDGQQRIRSILDFAKNDYELIGEDVSPTLHGKSFEDLTDSQKRDFWNYDVVTRELSDASDGDIRDLFRRLNISSVTLNDQELRHAKYKGVFLKLMEKLADDEWWTDARVVNVRQVRRMEDVEYISELFVALMAGPQDKKSTLDDFYDDYENSFPEKARWESVFMNTRDLLSSIFPFDELRAWSGKSDFYSLFSVLGGYVERGKKFTSTERTSINKALSAFQQDVALAKKRGNETKFALDVHSYADAVTRAATDAGRRKIRAEILGKIINRAIKPKKTK